MAEVALSGLRPAIPDACPKGLRRLLAYTWHNSPNLRPSFQEVLLYLDGMALVGTEAEADPRPTAPPTQPAPTGAVESPQCTKGEA